MHYPTSSIPSAPPATATYWVKWPCGVLGWHECTPERYEAILARPEAYSGTMVARVDALPCGVIGSTSPFGGGSSGSSPDEAV